MSDHQVKVLVVEDDPSLREALVDTLELSGYGVVEAASGEQALQQLIDNRSVEMVVSDVHMGGMDGLQLLKQVRSLYPHIPMLLITAYGSIDKSVEAMRCGAVDYLVKPFPPAKLVELVARYTQGVNGEDVDGSVVASDPASLQLLQLAKRVAETDSTVLICGESGTGKEVLARYIHQMSGRADAPFVAINCAAIPENMLEAILFGHEKGAFTGAHARMPGKFEQANGGTLLLDEISEMDLSLQAKLLRVIQEREVERLGGRETIALDLRLLATTNRHLQQEVAEGRFREDLYYRLSVFPLQWLPLRERPLDIVPIAEMLLANHAKKMSRAGVILDTTAKQALQQHPWPGNVRELDNVIQRALIMQSGAVIQAQDLRLNPYAVLDVSAEGVVTATKGASESSADLGQDLQRHEFQRILDTLREQRGRKKQAADVLGISPRTLRYKLAKMREEGIDVEAELKIA